MIETTTDALVEQLRDLHPHQENGNSLIPPHPPVKAFITVSSPEYHHCMFVLAWWKRFLHGVGSLREHVTGVRKVLS